MAIDKDEIKVSELTGQEKDALLELLLDRLNLTVVKVTSLNNDLISLALETKDSSEIGLEPLIKKVAELEDQLGYICRFIPDDR